MQNKIYILSENPPVKRGIFYLYTFFIIGFLFYSVSLTAQGFIQFNDTKKNFGFVKKGEIVLIDFEFSNSGNEPFVISDARFECSCTSVDFPKHPITPGQKSKLTVKFDTKTVYYRQDRTIEILSTAKNSPAIIRFKGVVLNK